MAYIKTDTTKLKEHGENINKLVDEYDDIINDLFKKIKQSNKENGAIFSTSADAYIEALMKRKEKYVNLGKNLKKYGNSLILYANSLELSKKGDE